MLSDHPATVNTFPGNFRAKPQLSASQLASCPLERPRPCPAGYRQGRCRIPPTDPARTRAEAGHLTRRGRFGTLRAFLCAVLAFLEEKDQ